MDSAKVTSMDSGRQQLTDDTPQLASFIAMCGSLLPGTALTPASNIFEVGGDSLTVIALRDEVDARWGVALDFSSVFLAENFDQLFAKVVEGFQEKVR